MKILIIDDSIVFRTAIKTALLNSPAVSEVDVASNGKIGCEKLQYTKFDGVTLDLEMPVMDGIETIKKIRSFNKEIPIIIFSAQNINAANKTMKALEMGANDFVQKLQNSTDVQENLKMIQKDVVPKLEALISGQKSTETLGSSQINHNVNLLNQFRADLLCFGSSTGGPDFLMKVFSGLKKLRVPLLMVQHMPPVFTTQLARTLDGISENKVVEAKHGDILEPGVCYIAPGDYHMSLVKEGEKYQLALDQSEKVCFVRPAVDVLFSSVAKCFSGKVGAFVFTGMGQDGANGCLELKKKQSAVFIQDESSSVVWGMPRAVYMAKAYDDILTPEKIIDAINKLGT
jgi:two-component system chemotaxis response regulator CheB